MSLPKPKRKMLKEDTLKIKAKYKEDPKNKEKHKAFNEFAKTRYKEDVKIAKASKTKKV